MRSRFAAATSYPDLSLDVPGRLGVETVTRTDRDGVPGPVQMACYDKSSVALVLGLFQAAPLCATYQARAKAASAAHGCANCRGIETLKSMLAARRRLQRRLALPMPDMPLHLRYGADLLDQPFGQCPPEYYQAGLLHQPGAARADEPMNPVQGSWYATLRQNQQHLRGPEYLAVTKQSANAHSVIARKTLEAGFRYALCEYLAAPTSPGLRDVRRVAPQSLALAGWHQPDPQPLLTRWDELREQFGDALAGRAGLTGTAQVELARAALDGLQSDLSRALRAGAAALGGGEAGDPAATTATLAGLCTLYRHLLLAVSAGQRRFAPDLREALASVLTDVACADDETNPQVSSVDVTNIHSRLDQLTAIGSASAAHQAIRTVGLMWQNESSVEFGHQCGLCEDAQGDADLSRRLVDYAIAHHGTVTPNPSFGVLFADLALAADDSAETVWDLSGAVTCQAVEVFYRSLCQYWVKKGTPEPHQDFLAAVAHHCNQTAPLFVAYLQVLMLELAYCGPDQQPGRRVVKLLTPVP